jgi:2-polyprenyl-6-methoxyphenol hydroxylase-like FAD-dependent oxidoreductase
MPAKPRILIVGAGIAGLTLAASLERFGITPVVAEIGNASMARGLALMLTSNVVVALRRVGLDNDVIGNGIMLKRIVHMDPSGTPVEATHDLEASNERYGPCLGITRDGLMSALSGSIRANIRYSTTIARISGLPGAPDVLLSDGTRAQFDLVVGADGVGSAVRRLIYPDVEPAYRGFCAWRTVIECQDPDPVFRLSTTTGSFLGSFPAGDGLMYAFLLTHYAEPPLLPRGQLLARLKELAASYHGNVSQLIMRQDDPASIIFVPVLEVETAAYHRGRILLLGDAAHAFSPVLAQGAAMAIEDAVTLAELIGSDVDIDVALQIYESRRRPRVETIRAAVRRRTIARGMEGPVTDDLLSQHPPVFSASLKVFDELIEDPFGGLSEQAK